jgi:hypothetical protein
MGGAWKPNPNLIFGSILVLFLDVQPSRDDRESVGAN